MPDAITLLSETLIRALGHSLWQAVMLLRGLTGFVIARRWLVESAAVAESGLQELKDIVKELSGR